MTCVSTRTTSDSDACSNLQTTEHQLVLWLSFVDQIRSPWLVSGSSLEALGLSRNRPWNKDAYLPTRCSPLPLSRRQALSQFLWRLLASLVPSCPFLSVSSTTRVNMLPSCWQLASPLPRSSYYSSWPTLGDLTP